MNPLVREPHPLPFLSSLIGGDAHWYLPPGLEPQAHPLATGHGYPAEQLRQLARLFPRSFADVEGLSFWQDRPPSWTSDDFYKTSLMSVGDMPYTERHPRYRPFAVDADVFTEPSMTHTSDVVFAGMLNRALKGDDPIVSMLTQDLIDAGRGDTGLLKDAPMRLSTYFTPALDDFTGEAPAVHRLRPAIPAEAADYIAENNRRIGNYLNAITKEGFEGAAKIGTLGKVAAGMGAPLAAGLLVRQLLPESSRVRKFVEALT